MDWIIICLSIICVLLAVAFLWWTRQSGAVAERLRDENARLREEKERLAYDYQSAAQGYERELAETRAQNRVLTERMEHQSADRQKLEEQFTAQFRNLANDILEEKTRRFTESNNRNIGDLLRPLGENLEKFRQRVEQESTQRQILEKEIQRLHEMSNLVSKEANNLASALRGNSKIQGDWGEMILNTMLESSGLQKNLHFRVQESFTGEEGNRLRPDVVIDLPEGKQIVVDSKVSLTAYVNCVECEDEAGRQTAMAAHVRSVRNHIQELSSKNYQSLNTASPDFVIMFIPNEPAFLMALQQDSKLWNEAYSRKVILSSPTNLFAILKIVEDLWRRDKQDKYAIEIAEQGGRLFDKFAGFAESFEAVGIALDRTEKAYETATKQLSEGKGNMVSQAMKLKQMGVKTRKNIPARFRNEQEQEDVAVQTPLIE